MKTLLLKLRCISCFVTIFFILGFNQVRAQSALSFNGTSDYVSIPSMNFGNNWTAEAWVNPSTTGGTFWKTIISQSFWNGSSGFAIAIANNLVFVQGPQGFNIETPINANVWTHVAATYNNGIFAFYKNGILVGTQLGSFANSSAPFFIGRRNNNNVNNNSSMVDAFAGSIDEVRIWNSTRSQCEIQQYMNAEIPTSAAGLIANYHFNQCSGNTLLDFLTPGCGILNDASGNGNTGNLSGFVLLSAISPVWSTPGCPAQGNNTPAPASTTEINLFGNATSILDGSSAPSISNHTDFGTAITRTFVIQNIGTQTLNVGIPLLTGPGANQFSVAVPPASLVAAGTGSTSFVVAFTPTSLGAKTATINIYNSDCSEPVYDFVITATAAVGSALHFDGVNDFIETNANLTELGQGDFTIEAWIKTNSTGQGIVSCLDGNTSWNAGEKSFYVNPGGFPTFVGWGNNYINSTLAVNDGNWHHVAVVWDYYSGNAGAGKMYIDGVDRTGGVSYAANNNNVGTFKIGHTNYGGTEAPNNFTGEIDEVRIWNRVVCLPEIINNMNCELPSPLTQPGLMAYYKLNSGLAGGLNTGVSLASEELGITTGTLTNFTLNGPNSNWTGPGAVVSGSTCTVYLYPEIDITGNGNAIVHRNTVPITSNHSSFGQVFQGTVLSRTFVIQNSGTNTLTINSYALSGINASSFTITTNPSPSVIPSSSTSIVVSFHAGVLGISSATLTVNNNDCDEGNYFFTINAESVPPAAALSLGGVNDYVGTTGLTIGTSDCTIETWFKQTSAATGGYMITTRSTEGGPNGGWWALSVGSGTQVGTVFWEIAASTGTYLVIETPPNTFSLNVWNHLAAVRSGSQLLLYVNGVLHTSYTEPVTRNFNTTVLRVGGWVEYNAAWYSGMIDETRIWNTARTQCEIQTYMNCEIPGTASGLLANYHFNQGISGGNNSTITSVLDATGNYNATLNNVALTGTTSNWVSPGGVVSGFTTTAPPTASILVSGNSNSITPGSTSTSTLNFTDFAAVNTRTFVIQNPAAGTLNVGTPYFTGVNASEFSVTTLPSPSLAASATTSFVVVFTPSVAGFRTATLNIISNDCNIPVFSCALGGTAVVGSALDFDGNNDYVACGSILNTSYTKEAWIKLSSGVTQYNMLSGGSGSSGHALFAPNSFGNRLSSGHNGTWNAVQDPNPLAFNTWYHVAVTYDAATTTMKLYKNGLLVSTNTNVPQNTINTVNIGWYDLSSFFKGTIDEVRIWNTVRSQCEIADHMNCEIAGAAPGLIANYHFNQGLAGGLNTSVASLTDAAGSNTGTITNMGLLGLNSNWVSPGGVISGSNCPVFTYPEMIVQGNSVTILNGSTLPNPANFTQFNNAYLGTTFTRTFVIQNSGTSSLSISNVSLSGVNASDFSITISPAASVAASGSTSLVITFSPATIGVKLATVTIVSNDCENPFTFAIQSTGIAPGEALDFDGGNDYVDLGNTNMLKPAGALTVEGWVHKANWTLGGNEAFISNTENGGYEIRLTGGSLNGTVYRNGAFGTNSVSLTSVTPGWHHLAMTYDGRYTKLYLDGAVMGTNDAGGNYPITYVGNNTFLGAKASATNTPTAGWYADAKMDEFRVWDVALTQCEIQTYMHTEITGSVSGLVANYHFNEGLVNMNNAGFPNLSDASGSNTGTLVSFALTGTVSNWVAQGAVLSGISIPNPPTSSISISGNGNAIPPGSSTTSTLNFTDFAGVSSRTFSIQNSGTGTLSVNPFISLSGGNAGDFSVTTAPANSITTGSTSFVITFSATALGSRTATVNVGSSDCTHPNYSFVITGSAAPASALDFDGTGNNRVFVPSGINLNNQAFTVEFWSKRTSTLSNFVVGSGNNINTNESLHIGFRQGNVFTFAFYSNDINYTTTATSDGNYHHWACVYDPSLTGTNRFVYLDGVLVASDYSGSALNAPAGPFVIGDAGYYAGFPNPHTGTLDELRVWGVARAQCDIQTFMNCEIPTTASGLLANYHFNQGLPSGANPTYTTLIDATGNYNGNLSSFSLSGNTSNWVSPGGVVSGYTTAIAPTASLAVSGNGNTIANNSTTTSTLNFTDFGAAFDRNFAVQNSGLSPLYINSTVLSGAHASDFSIAATPSQSLAASASSSFVISFAPTALGTRSAVVSLYSSDCSTPVYSFVITATAVPGACLRLDGINDHAIAPVFSTADNNITLKARVFWGGTGAGDRIIAYNGNTSTNGYGLFVGSSTNSVSILYGGIHTQNTGYTLTPNQWTALALVIETSQASFYVNGVLTSTFSLSNPSTPLGSFVIGSTQTGIDNFIGSIDEVQLWERALTACEIQAYQNCEVAASANSLVANYHFNQGIAGGNNTSVTTLLDASGNSNDLNLNGFVLNGLSSNWMPQGALISGSFCAAYSEPDILITGNNQVISNGASSASAADDTDFGNISTNGGLVKTYTIQNTGLGALTVNSITLSGVNASEFMVGALTPTGAIVSNSFAVFSVTFAPVSAGTKTAFITVNSDDCDDAVYQYLLSGDASPAAAIRFDGTNDYINCGNILNASYTKEAWVNIGISSNGNNFLGAGTGITGSAFWAPGIYGYNLSAGHDGDWDQVQDNTPLVAGTWYHVAVTYDAPSTTMNLYKNGALVASSNTVAAFTGTSPLHIGAFAGTFVTTGLMDEVRIWNRALCQSEIQNNMNCEIPASASGLVGNYHFNQGVGFGSNTTNTLLTDASGSANTGTLVNFAVTGTLSNWVSTSTITSGFSCTPVFIPEINLVGNLQNIVDGDNTPDASDDTDFGNVCLNGQIVKTFSIQNTGTSNLAISTISLAGTGAAMFSAGPVTPSTLILPGNTSVFSVTFTPSSAGLMQAQIVITNNDCNEDPYNFSISGTCSPLPVVGASTSNSVICDGQSTILNGSGADTYTWTGGSIPVTNGLAFTPSLTVTYTVIGTNTLTGCTSTNLALQTITVNPNPTVSLSSNFSVVCEGSSVNIIPSGALTYTLEPGTLSATAFTVSPGTTTSYSVVGTSSNGCQSTNTAVTSVTVNPLPVVTASSSNSVICNTQTTSLSGGGADTYTWTGGVTDGVAFTPTITDTYTVTGTNTLTGCSSTNLAVQTITVEIIPTVSISASSSVICDGETATLTASGANSYTWNPGSFSGNTFTINPNTFSTYTLQGTSSAGCTSTNLAVQSVSVNSLPTVTAGISNSVICLGSSVTVNAAGALTYTWSGGITEGNAFEPLSSGSYSVSGTNSAGCTSTNQAVVSITVNTLPSVSISATNPVICVGDQSSLSGNGALTYTWSGGIVNGIAFSPSVTSTYSVTGTDANGCENGAIITVTVNNLPQLSIVGSPSVSCEAQTTSVTASGANTYTWSSGENTNAIVFTPTANTSYTVLGVDENGCQNTATYTQSVIICPEIFTATVSTKDITCSGKNDGEISVEYTNTYASSEVSYVWNPRTLCSDNSCDTLKNLSAGVYYLTLKVTYTLNNTLVKVDSLVLDPITLSDINGQCAIKVFNGVSANGDGVNDVMIIENIEQFPDNRVWVYNRWGQLIFETSGYDNTNKAWPANGEQSNLSSNTYFYIIDLGNGNKPIKGWVELMKN